MSGDQSKQSKGGDARAASLSKAQRGLIARTAAAARWERAGKLEGVPTVLCGSPDQPLIIEWLEDNKPKRLEIPCYVLDDERRVIVQGGMMTALDMSQGTAGRGDGDRLARFLATKSLNSFVSEQLREMIISPIRFRVASGALAYGYEATILADICDTVLRARKEGGLNYQQEHIAAQCEILIRSFAKVGIIALVDEATGFQFLRQRDALQELLREFLSDELRRWVKTFPDAYFKEMCRLRGVVFRSDMKLPQHFGHFTNNIVYSRLAPNVLNELQARNPKDESGRRLNKHHQWLSEHAGHPKLLHHLGLVVGLMKVSRTWEDFMGLLDKAAPVYKDLGMFNPLQAQEDG